MKHILRNVLLCVLCLAPPLAVCAQPPNAASAEQRLLYNVYRLHFVPRAAVLATSAEDLKAALSAMCSAPSAESLHAVQRAWVEAMLAWESLGAVAIGPLLERHTEANIDFMPTRAPMIEGTLKQSLADTRALRGTGVAGRGLPALEWLLWVPADAPRASADRAACNYALLLARDVVEEAQTLQTRFLELAKDTPDSVGAVKSTEELVNQCVSAVEVLRRKRLFNPVAVGNPKVFARALSGQVQPAWTVRWQSIRSLLVGERGDEPDTLSALLRDRDLAAAAGKLRAAVERSSSALALASPARLETARHAADALMVLRATLQQDVAESLHISTSFSDFDGD